MSALLNDLHDVMLVCCNGHVVTDRLRTQPERQHSHCDRCGAPTLFRCPTCGMELPGAAPVELVTVGQRQLPRYCSTCGAAFPWTISRSPPQVEPLLTLENMLRRLPRTIRELKLQAGSRAPFRLDDERDLEYLLRAVLPLFWDDVRLHGRNPGYCPFARTDFLLMPGRIALTAKLALAAGCEESLPKQLREDVAHYKREKTCPCLVVLVYDPQGFLPEPEHLEELWSRASEDIPMRCVLAG